MMYQFAENLKSDKAFYFYRGSVALYALLKSMGVGPGDEVILPVFTCPAVPSPVVRLGATPVYVDIYPETFNIDPEKIEPCLTKNTKALIIQHTFGIPAELEPILDIARNHKLWVIEDACHALGSRYKGQEVGTFGDAAIYSFGWYKPIELGTGGAAVVNHPSLKTRLEETVDTFIEPSWRELATLYLQYSAYRLLYTPSRFWTMKEIYRRLRDFKSGPRQGQIKPLLFGPAQPTLQADKPNGYDLNITSATSSPASSLPAQNVAARITVQPGNPPGKKMIAFQEGRLFKKLDRWDGLVDHQSWITTRYGELLAQLGYPPFKVGGHLEPVYYKYPLLFANKKEIFEKARQAGVEMSDMFGSPLYPAERAANWRALGYRQGMCPISESVSDRIVALPVHARVQAEQIENTGSIFMNSQK